MLALLLLLAAPIESQLHVRAPMRDGVRLCANVFLPAAKGRFPALLVRTPYGKGAQIAPNYRAFVERGYALVVQDVRGRFDSKGVFDPLNQETPDGEDTLKWIVAQPWSNGSVGMLGGSYLGIVQWRLALTSHPALKAIFPTVSGDDDYFDRFYSRGGALKLGHRLSWLADNWRAPDYIKPEFSRFVLHLPLRTADRAAAGQRIDMYQQALDHPAYDAFWKSLSVRERLAQIRVPVYAAGGWFDNFGQGDLEAFAELRKLGRPARLIVGPWPHNMSIPFPGADYGRESSVPLRTLQLEWFDYWLKPGPEKKLPAGGPLRIFVMGANHWRDEREWPLRRTRWTPMYLSSRGNANTLGGDGVLTNRPGRREPPDRYAYDPRNPAPTQGGAVCCNPKTFPWGPMDQRPVERRRDVLVYDSRPLKEDLEVTGPVKVILHVSTSAPDTDFTAKLVDVFPDGLARNLTDGILRLRYRQSLERPVLSRPNEIYSVTIDAGVTSNVFKAGHRLRLEISSSNFPRFDRNPNTGRAVADDSELRNALQAVHHDRAHPSHILLPVIPPAMRK
ncbi:MAG: CocE/NonD family hydrolase [Acidobacteria bacterium]|nr:CocE/NonD family hydrolase [Acidobacteriota bacterium]